MQIQPADAELGVTRIQVTASWSRALDSTLLPWTFREDLAPGMAWLGLDDARQELVVPMWETGPDGKVSVIHVWLIGRTGGGKSTTLRTLLAPGVIRGLQLLILLDGKGDSLAELAPYAIGGAVARDGQSWRQGIALAYAIMTARRRRLGTPNAWKGPTPEDPVVTIVIDECTTVRAALSKREIRMLCEIARMGRSVGVNSIQAGQIPLVDSLIGESEWRSQARLVIGHGVLDAVHNRLATQSGGSDGPSLLRLPNGRVVVLMDGDVLAIRAKVSLLQEEVLIAAAKDSLRASLSELDRTVHVCRLMDLADEWGTSAPDSIVDLDGLLDEWGDEGETTGSGGRAGAPAPVTTRPNGAGPAPAKVPAQGGPGGRSGRGTTTLRELVLTYVMTHAGVTKPQLVQHFQEHGGYAKSAVYKEINWLIDNDRIAEHGGGLVSTLDLYRAERLAEEQPV
ncbi:MAG TPA: hypothetical protein VI248_02185 [Kineosporiaceae bacterium]